MENKVAIGEVVSPSGFKGQFKIKSFTEKKDDFFKYGPISISDKFVDINLVKIKSSKDMFVVSYDKITTKEEAEEIRGATILVDRERLPAIDNTETFYHYDLINMNVYDEKNIYLGTVISIDNYGSDDVIEIKSDVSDSTMLISLNKKFIDQIDLIEKKFLVKNVEGYFNEKNI
jgi:16S rRNA processing protein RimM|tara:strand:- start:1306 stop:1827 length:522 start_codon:yes stop_codon:yes gene_type:complete